MNRACWIFVSLLVFALGLPALAQDVKSLQQPTIAEVMDFWITNTEKNIMSAAEAMPADKYPFRPPARSGEFKNVRTFAEQLKHLAANNYQMAALMMEDKPTAEMESETGPNSVRSRAEIIDYVKGSYAALHKAVAAMNEKNVVQTIASPSKQQTTRLAFAVDAVAHSWDHYGQLVEYLRMNNIIPPGSR